MSVLPTHADGFHLDRPTVVAHQKFNYVDVEKLAGIIAKVFQEHVAAIQAMHANFSCKVDENEAQSVAMLFNQLGLEFGISHQVHKVEVVLSQHKIHMSAHQDIFVFRMDLMIMAVLLRGGSIHEFDGALHFVTPEKIVSSPFK